MFAQLNRAILVVYIGGGRREWWMMGREIMVLTNCGYICYNNPDQKQNKTKIKQKLEFELEINRT